MSLAIAMMRARSTPRNRSIALSSTGCSPATFTLAMPWTLTGMPPFEYAPCTATSIGMLVKSIESTVSSNGMRKARPPLMVR